MLPICSKTRLGDDAVQMYTSRVEAGDDAFMVGMRQQMLG